jgi:hypothetical protein
VVVITDKPQKPIPWELFDEIRAEMPTEESHAEAFVELWSKAKDWGYEFGNLPEDERKAAKQMRQDAAYLGWATVGCANEFRLTEEGHAVLDLKQVTLWTLFGRDFVWWLGAGIPQNGRAV